MYHRCLFCHSRFATNAEFPELPIGRRIAFDPVRGRLWVVCRRCDGWNLSPFDRRIETIDQCEALWEEAKRVDTTPGITLFRTGKGVELLRVGEDTRAEFTSWRLGSRFMHRQGIRGIQLGLGLGIAGLVVAGAVKTFGVVVGIYGVVLLSVYFERVWNRPIVQVPTAPGPWPVTRRDLRRAVWFPGHGSGVLRIPKGGPVWTGADAAVPLMLMMPLINRSGGSRRQRARAVALLESLKDPLEMFGYAAERWPGRLRSMPIDARLALEMATNEQVERDNVEGDLESLADAWHEAEETAAIADSLLIPDWMDSIIARWKSDRPLRTEATKLADGSRENARSEMGERAV